MADRFGVKLYKQAFNFASAHFLIFPDGRREQLHGHNYRLKLELEGSLDEASLVADFIEVKPLVRALCDDLDHRVMLAEYSDAYELCSASGEVEVRLKGGGRFVFPSDDVVLLPIANTSTERLSQLLGERLRSRLLDLQLTNITRLRVEVEESGGQSGWCELSNEALA